MTLPFPQAYYGAVGQVLYTDPIAWWKRGTKQYTNTLGSLAATSSGDPIRNWTDDIGGYIVTQAGTGPNFPPELHSDLESVLFSRDPNFLLGASGLAALVAGSDVPFTIMTRIKSPASFSGLTFSYWAWRKSGTPVANFAFHAARFSASGNFATTRRDTALSSKTIDSVGAVADNDYIMIHSFDGQDLTEYANGSAIYTGGDLDVGSCDFDSFILGASDSAGGASFDGLMMDLLVFDHVINSQTRTYWSGQIA